MKRIVLSVLVLLGAVFQGSAQRNISIFCDHVETIAQQQGISFSEAAGKVRALGYNGVDVRVNITDQKLHTLDSLGFRRATAITHIDLTTGEHREECRQALDFMRKQGYTKLLLVPGLVPEDADEEFMKVAYARIASFVREAQQQGVDVMVENFDHPRSICYNTPALDRLFGEAPALSHVFDTGNYLFCGEDVMIAYKHFRQRIHHVHLKDRKAAGQGGSPAVGTGIAPIKEVVLELLKTGYDGWLTVEHFGSKDMLGDATVSIAYVNAILDESF